MYVTHFKTFLKKDTMSSFTEQITPKTSGMQYKIEMKFQKCKTDYSIYLRMYSFQKSTVQNYILYVLIENFSFFLT